MTLPSTGRHRVVIVGSGFGGLFAVKSLARVPAGPCGFQVQAASNGQSP
jgi:NADH dehydrogenase FAD-containing subunit